MKTLGHCLSYKTHMASSLGLGLLFKFMSLKCIRLSVCLCSHFVNLGVLKAITAIYVKNVKMVSAGCPESVTRVS